MRYNFKEDIKINKKNYRSINPVSKQDIRRKKINGRYIYEEFYLIDFFGIRQNSYIISSFGRVFSLISNRELKPSVTKKRNNYMTIQLSCENGKPRRFPVHTLVAAAFIPKIKSDKELNRVYVHHKNWDNEYNYFWNLEWRSPLEIMLIGRMQTNKDITHEEIVKIVCMLLEKNTSLCEIWHIIQGNISMNKLKKIRSREIYTDISRNYHF